MAYSRKSAAQSIDALVGSLQPGQGVLYTRESTRGKVSVSTEQQLGDGLAYSKYRDLPEPRHMPEIHSASTGVRIVYEAILIGIQRGIIPFVIARDDDRLLRGLLELETLIPILMQTECPVYFFAASDYELTTPDGRMMARMRAVIARGEVEKKSKRQKQNNAHRANDGKPFHSFAGFGYQWDGEGRDRRRIQLPAEAEGILWAKKHIQLGGTCADMAREWNKRGLVNQRGNPWQWSAARKAMLNPALCGYRAYQPSSVFVPGFKRRNDWEFEITEMTKSDWEPILTVEEWQSVRDILTRTKSQAGNHVKYLGSGIYECGTGRCPEGTRLFSSRLSAKQGGHLRYRCVVCGGINVRAERVDEFVTEVLGLQLLKSGTFDAVLGIAETAQGIDVGALQAEEDSLRNRLDELAESHARGRTPLAMMERSAAMINKRLAEIGEQRAEYGKHVEERRFFADPQKILDAWDNGTIEIHRHILTSVFPKIIIRSPGKGRAGKPPREYVELYDRKGMRLRFDEPKSLLGNYRALMPPREAEV